MKLLQCGYGHIGEILFKNEFAPIARAVKGELYTYDYFTENEPSIFI